MKGKFLVRFAVCILAIFAYCGASHASMIHVSIAGSISVPGIAPPLAGNTFSIDFNMPLMPENSAPPEWGVVATSVNLHYVSGPLSRNIEASAAWFLYDNGYSGVDFYLPDVTENTEDFFQLIVAFEPFESGFTGRTRAPTMKLVTYTGLGGNAYYAPDASNYDDYVDSPLYDVTYSTSAIPIPAAAWLFGSALLCLVGLKRKKT